MRRIGAWALLILVLALVLGAGGFWAFWNYDLRWRPKTFHRGQTEIASLLSASGWVSPGGQGRKLYVVASRQDPAAARWLVEELPKLKDAGVDTRVILVAQRDANGQAGSSPVERATVAQLWITRDWNLFQQWMAAPAWSAQGIPATDGDMARMAVVESGRQLVDRLTPLMKDNGVRLAFPTLVWWNAKGEMKGCACRDPRSWRFVRRDLAG